MANSFKGWSLSMVNDVIDDWQRWQQTSSTRFVSEIHPDQEKGICVLTSLYRIFFGRLHCSGTRCIHTLMVHTFSTFLTLLWLTLRSLRCLSSLWVSLIKMWMRRSLWPCRNFSWGVLSGRNGPRWNFVFYRHCCLPFTSVLTLYLGCIWLMVSTNRLCVSSCLTSCTDR